MRARRVEKYLEIGASKCKSDWQMFHGYDFVLSQYTGHSIVTVFSDEAATC